MLGEKGRDDEIHCGCAAFGVTEIYPDGVIQDSAGNNQFRAQERLD